MNIETVKNTIATCRSFKACNCFNKIFALQPFYNPLNEQEYVAHNKQALQAYTRELLKHFNKDILYNQTFYQSVPAETLKKAFDHHLQTLHLFERYILKTTSNETITYRDGTSESDISYYVDTILKLISSYEKTNRLFNQPTSPIPSQRILDEVDFHQYTIKLFEKFILFQTHSKTDCQKQYGHIIFTRKHDLHNTQTGWSNQENSNEFSDPRRFYEV